ncbi:MAG: tetratricopeptide repeat protein [Spirochaetia bacterium]|nr:tetratricopeptide repeat protein [Spirochaetia bacterium]
MISQHFRFFSFSGANAGQLLLVAALALPAIPLAAQDFYHQGKVAYGQRNYEKARQLFERSLETNPANGNPCFYLGYMLDNANRRDLAVNQYRRGVDSNMDADLRDKAFWKIVLYYKYVQDWDNLAIYSEKFLRYRDIQQIKDFLEEAKEKRDPALAKTRDLTASAERKKESGDLRGAEADYKAVLANKWDEHTAWNLAALEMQLREYREALTYYNKLIEQKPGWEYYYKRGVAHYSLRNYDDSLADFLKARSLNKKPDAGFKYYLAIGEGLSLLESGKHIDARAKLTEASKLKKSPVALAALARIELATGNRKLAESFASKLEIADRERDLIQALLYYNSDQKADERKLGREAFVKWAGSIKQDETFQPSYSASLFLLAKQACILSDPELCLNALEKIPEGDQQKIGDAVKTSFPMEKRNAGDIYHEFDFYYGKALLDRNRTDAALSRLGKVQDLPIARYYMASAYARKADEKNAMDYLQRAAEKNPEYWDYAKKNADFQALARKSADFAYFIQNNGKVRQTGPEPVRGNVEVNTNETKKDPAP